MKINFTAKNGLCPYFIYNDTKYYITDKLVGNRYIYCLCSVNVNTNCMRFQSKDEALEFVTEQTKDKHFKVYKFSDYIGCIASSSNYVIYDKKPTEVIILDRGIDIATGFESYESCLIFAKDYLQRELNSQLEFRF